MLKKIFGGIDPNYARTVTRAGTIGLHFVTGIFVGGIMGFFLDKWLESAPIGLGLGLVFGVAAGFNNVYIDSKRLIASQDGQKDAKNSQKN